ncbi:hypothetical protein MNBD_ACTINO02-1993 [hydrothermal vent metagenome]|uniref:Uncharacterized protein n=1 Tax=hydrothermal vent metagenome TaxID=652676 RepID=A0A3B0S3G5_9ZZZZ
MRRTTSVWGGLSAIVVLLALTTAVWASDVCYFDPDGAYICQIDEPPSGGPVVGPPVEEPPEPPPPPSLQFLYTGIDPNTGGDCYYWSSVPGGLDAWNAANDPAVITITTSFPECTAVPVVVIDLFGWEVFRSWPLAGPEPTMSPEVSGVTGVPTWITATPAGDIIEDVVLPDGRTLQVRGRIVVLSIDWGDGTWSNHLPTDALIPGAVQHTYATKTCTAAEREERRGELCHPSLEAYPITLVYTWEGEYRVLPDAAWTVLGTLDRTTTVDYDIDEIVGVLNG